MSNSSLSPRGKPVPRVRRHERPFQHAVRRIFARPGVELTVAVLVLLSVVLTLAEFTYETALDDGSVQPALVRLQWINDALTFLFTIELTLRYLGSSSKKRFFREFWLDILAVTPAFWFFPVARPLRLLRLVRVLRLFGAVARLSSQFPYILRRGAAEYLVVCGLLIMTVVVGTGAIMFFERGHAGQLPAPAREAAEEDDFDFEHSFWFSVYSLLAGEPTPIPPRTLGGKIVAVFIMFMGLTIFAMFTGTVSAFMVERFRMQERIVDWDELHDHIIICGWNTKSEIIVQEYRASSRSGATPIAVIAQFDTDPPVVSQEIKERVVFLNDDFTRIAALEQAGVHRASTCIILSDTSGGRSEQDADARTILAALTVEKLNPAVYTCAELLNRSYGMHLQMGRVNDYVVSGEFSAYMLAQAAMNRGLMEVFTELLTYQRGNEFYRLQLSPRCYGKRFLELLTELKQQHNAILVAVHPAGGSMLVNPPDHTFSEGDEIVVIADREIKL